MTINDEIGALVLKNTRINPVNQTAYKNAFLLLSSTRALNELVTNTKPSDRARKQGIEDDAQYLKTPSGGRSDRKDPDAPDPNAPKPKARKKAPPKTDATPAQKPKPKPKPVTSSVKTPTTAASTPTTAAPTRKDGKVDGRSKGARAAKRAVTAKAVATAKEAAKQKADVESEAKKQAANKAEVKRLKQVKADADAERKALEGRKEGQAIPLGDVKLRGGNSSDRRLGTKTQKKKK